MSWCFSSLRQALVFSRHWHIIAIFVLCSVPAQRYILSAQNLSDQLWHRLAEADRALDDRQFDEALAGYRSALRLRDPLPEAEVGIAAVLQSEGLVDEAERHLLRALDNSNHFLLAENEYRARYQLAHLYENSAQRSKFEEMLLSITNTEQQFADRRQNQIRQQVLVDRGIDRLFELYRFGELYTLSAHAQLGEHYVVSGNYGRAVDHLIFAIVKKGEQIVAIGTAHGLDAQSLPFTELLNSIRSIRILERHARAGYDINRILFYLGAALYGHAPHSIEWMRAWSVVANDSRQNEWTRRARSRLSSPRLEPLVN